MKKLRACFLSAFVLGTAFAQEPTKPEQPPRPPEAGRDERPPLPPGEQRDGKPPRGPEGREDGQQRPDRPPFPPPGGERRPEGFSPREGDPRQRGMGGMEGRRFEGDRRPDQPGFSSGERVDRSDRGMQQRMKPTPFIGVVSSAPPAALSVQLGLGEGFGLVVDEVLPDSPAQTAGVQRYDVLKQLNEQQLVDPAQLGTLVRSLGKDTEAALTVIRKGQEQKLTIKIGEKMLPERRSEDMRGSFGFPDIRRGGGDMSKQPFPFDSPRSKPGQPGEPNQPSHPPMSPDFPRDGKPGGPGQPRSESGSNESRWDTSRARITMRDRDGEAELVTKDGHRTLTVRSAAGETVFTGTVDTPEQRQALSEPVRDKLTALESAPAPQEQRPDGFRRGGAPEQQGFNPQRPRSGGVQ